MTFRGPLCPEDLRRQEIGHLRPEEGKVSKGHLKAVRSLVLQQRFGAKDFGAFGEFRLRLQRVLDREGLGYLRI